MKKILSTMVFVVCLSLLPAPSANARLYSHPSGSCSLGSSVDPFAVKLAGRKVRGAYLVAAVRYRFDSGLADRNNIRILASNGDAVWISPDSLRGSGRWETEPARFYLPLRQRFWIEAVGDFRLNDDARCMVSMRLS